MGSTRPSPPLEPPTCPDHAVTEDHRQTRAWDLRLAPLLPLLSSVPTQSIAPQGAP